VEYLDERDLNVYTDGSAYQGPRRGGVGILYVVVDADGAERIEDYPLPGYAGATNNQMEILAATHALAALATRRAPVDAADYRRVVVWTDSIYVVDGYTSARFSWPTPNYGKSCSALPGGWCDPSSSDGSRVIRRALTTSEPTSSPRAQRMCKPVDGLPS
jgi:hypothetical protein